VHDQLVVPKLNESDLVQGSDDGVEMLVEQCQQLIVADVSRGDHEQSTW